MSNNKLRDSNSLDTRQLHEPRSEQPTLEADEWHADTDSSGNGFVWQGGALLATTVEPARARQIVTDHARAALVPGLVDTLSELADLMDEVIQGDYKPDSFTCQPARIALAAARKAGVE